MNSGTAIYYKYAFKYFTQSLCGAMVGGFVITSAVASAGLLPIFASCFLSSFLAKSIFNKSNIKSAIKDFDLLFYDDKEINLKNFDEFTYFLNKVDYSKLSSLYKNELNTTFTNIFNFLDKNKNNESLKELRDQFNKYLIQYQPILKDNKILNPINIKDTQTKQLDQNNKITDISLFSINIGKNNTKEMVEEIPNINNIFNLLKNRFKNNEINLLIDNINNSIYFKPNQIDNTSIANDKEMIFNNLIKLYNQTKLFNNFSNETKDESIILIKDSLSNIVDMIENNEILFEKEYLKELKIIKTSTNYLKK